MLNLRRQVDRIDQRLLRLLQQRTKLSTEIGRTKRRHGAEIYVPDRERELLARVAKLANGKLPGPAVGAIFREILSSSRAAQGQAPIGVLQRSAAAVVPVARCHFGACDRFAIVAGWPEMKRQLLAGELTIGLLTFADLAALGRAAQGAFPGEVQVVGEMVASTEARGLADRIFIVKASVGAPEGKRALILIECKPEADAVNYVISAMPRVPNLVQMTPLSGRARTKVCLTAVTFSRPVKMESLGSGENRVGSVLGIYTLDESYAG
jgi:chorismate mutase